MLKIQLRRVAIRPLVQALQYRARRVAANRWLRLSAFLLLVYVLWTRDFSVQFSWGGNKSTQTAGALSLLESEPPAQAIATSLAASGKAWWEQARDYKPQSKPASEGDLGLNLANPATATGAALSKAQQEQAAKFSNLGFILNPGLAERKGIDPAIVQAKFEVCRDYIRRYAPTAQEEAKLYNIPASIKLAQGLLESNAGQSQLARKENNHFGIKCRNKCQGCRCANYTDDSKYDMFRIFDSPWHSFREHSKLLMGDRYKHLLKLPRSDYKAWAKGLKAAGYATAPNYAEQLIALIEALRLHEFDQ